MIKTEENIVCPDCKTSNNYSCNGIIQDMTTLKTTGEILKCKLCDCIFAYEYADKTFKAIVTKRKL